MLPGSPQKWHKISIEISKWSLFKTLKMWTLAVFDIWKKKFLIHTILFFSIVSRRVVRNFVGSENFVFPIPKYPFHFENMPIRFVSIFLKKNHRRSRLVFFLKSRLPTFKWNTHYSFCILGSFQSDLDCLENFCWEISLSENSEASRLSSRRPH